MNNLIGEFKKLRSPKRTEILNQIIHIHTDLTKNSQQSLKNKKIINISYKGNSISRIQNPKIRDLRCQEIMLNKFMVLK